MIGKVTPEKAMQFTTICAQLGACLSPPASAKNSEITRYKIYWWICVCVSLSMILPIMYDLYLNIEDINSVLLNTAELCPLYIGLWKMLVCKYYGQKLQACVLEVESFLRTVTLQDRELLQRYVDQRIKFYYFMLLCIVFTVVGFSSSPFILSQPYPAHTSYPFEVNTKFLKNTLRGLQIVALIQAGILVTLDFKFSALVWFTAARFELLSEELRRVSDTEQLCICILKHQEILQFADDVNLVTRFVAYGVALSTSIGSVFGGIQFLQDSSTMVKGRFVSFVTAGAFQLLGYSWPAEYLIENSRGIGFSVYSSPWIGQSPEMIRLISIMMQRAKKPSVISVGNFLPILSLNFYGSFLSTSFSYFTTLRATTTNAS